MPGKEMFIEMIELGRWKDFWWKQLKTANRTGR